MRIFVCAVFTMLLSLTAMAAEVTGKWSGSFTPEGKDPSSAYLILKQSGTTVTGSGGPDEQQQWPIADGKIVAGKLTGSVTAPDGTVYKIDVTLEGDSLNGKITATREGQNMTAKMEAKRVK